MFGASSNVSPLRSRTCPRCEDYALRVRRRLIDRVMHPFNPVHRYRCMSTSCGWVGNLKPRSRPEPRPAAADPQSEASGSDPAGNSPALSRGEGRAA